MTGCLIHVVMGSHFNLTCITETDRFNWTASTQDPKVDTKFISCPLQCTGVITNGFSGISVKYGEFFKNTLQILKANINLNTFHNIRCQSSDNISAAEPCNNVFVDAEGNGIYTELKENEQTKYDDPTLYVVLGVVVFLMVLGLCLYIYLKKKCSFGDATEVNTSLELRDLDSTSLLANTPTVRNVSGPSGFDMDRVCRTLAYNDDEIILTPGYVPSDNCRILRASIHQGDGILFKGPYCGFESCSMAMTIIMRAAILPISQWTRDIVTHSLIAGHRLYSMVIYKTCVKRHPELIRVGLNLPGRYLQVREFEIVTKCVLLFDNVFTLHFEDESQLFGNLTDDDNPRIPEEGLGKTLIDSFRELFDKHSAGIFIASNKPIAVISHENMFYMCDSHACGPDGVPTAEGKACVIQVDSLEALTYFCKRSAGNGSPTFTVEPVDVTVKRAMMPSTTDDQS